MATRSQYYMRRTIQRAACTVQQNFTGNSLLLTFSYLPGREPHSRATGRYFLTEDVIRPLRASRRAGGVAFRYCYSSRWPPDDTPPEHRLILSAGSETEEQLRGLWRYGPVTCCPLRALEPPGDLVARLYTEAARTALPGENLITFSQGLR